MDLLVRWPRRVCVCECVSVCVCVCLCVCVCQCCVPVCEVCEEVVAPIWALPWQPNGTAKRPSLSSNPKAASRKTSNNTGEFLHLWPLNFFDSASSPRALIQSRSEFHPLDWWNSTLIWVLRRIFDGNWPLDFQVSGWRRRSRDWWSTPPFLVVVFKLFSFRRSSSVRPEFQNGAHPHFRLTIDLFLRFHPADFYMQHISMRKCIIIPIPLASSSGE